VITGLASLMLNTVSADEHVPEIERHIRTIKERARSVINTLPFEGYPPRMIIELIYYCVFWLNSFPAVGGISDVMSPRTIITGTTIDYTNHCKLEYGTYVQTHEKHDNTMIPRTTGAIALRPTGNAQGGHYFYSLTSGKRINRNQWTELPMPADVVQRVDRLCRRPLNLTTLEFVDRAGVLPDAAPLDDETDDDNNNDDEDDDDDFDPDLADNAEIAGVDEEENEAAINENLAIMDNVNNLELELELGMNEDGVFDMDDVPEDPEHVDVIEPEKDDDDDEIIDNHEEQEQEIAIDDQNAEGIDVDEEEVDVDEE
jgi:hypothetical protein